jgi:hypothetical protein
MTESLKPGDVVRVKSGGGPKMVIERTGLMVNPNMVLDLIAPVEQHNTAELLWYGSDTGVVTQGMVKWKFHQERFALSALERATDEPPKKRRWF